MGITRAVAGFAVIGAGLALSLTTATGLSAQDIERAVAFGAAVPVGTIGTNRSLGPLLRAGVTLGDRQRRNLRLRLDLEASWLPGDSRALSGSWSGGTLAAISGFGSMVLGETGDPSTAPYFVLGLGVQRLAITGVANPYGATLAGRIGAGLQFRVGQRMMFAEVVPTLSATDFGSAADFSAGTVIPLVIGIRF